MTKPDPKNNDAAAMIAETLLVHYSFDLGHLTAAELVDKWLKNYPARWLRLAIIEALYQGRYKSISVEQILACWQRRSKPIYHFNLEFEQLICGKLPGANLPEDDVKLNSKASAEAEKAENITEKSWEKLDILLTNNPPSPMIARYIQQKSRATSPAMTCQTMIENTENSDLPEVTGLSTTENRETSTIAFANVDENTSNFLELITDKLVQEKTDDKIQKDQENGEFNSEPMREIINDYLIPDPWLCDADEAALSMTNTSISSINESNEALNEALNETLNQAGNDSINNSINNSINDSINDSLNGVIAASMSSADKSKANLSTILNLDSEPSTSASVYPVYSEGSWQEPRPPIHQFTPDVAASEFYMKLKAVLESKLEHPEEKPRKRRYRHPRRLN